MEITWKIKKSMEEDINRCEYFSATEGSEALFQELVSKYTVIDSDFSKNLMPYAKVSVPGTENDYRPQLKNLASKLRGYIMTGTSQNAQTLEEMLDEDIERISEVLSAPMEETAFIRFYREITTKYSSIVKDLGDGLYAYVAEHKFYITENIGIDSLTDNLSMIQQKLIAYRATHFNDSKKLDMKKKISRELSSRKVFIVHGHDNYAIDEVKIFLSKLALEPIVLREQADSGMTIIEKIEKQANEVCYAIVLYTPCDVGRAKEEGEEHKRARQNVVFEHGYLNACLSRKNVCALVKDNVEIPGDCSGIIYVTMDEAGAWKMPLIKNMKEAGIDVDANKLL